MVDIAAAAVTFKNPTTGTKTTTVLNGAAFSPSTNVELAAVANATNWAAVSKHVSGGTTSYGLLSTDTNITMTKDLAPDAAVTAPASETALQ